MMITNSLIELLERKAASFPQDVLFEKLKQARIETGNFDVSIAIKPLESKLVDTLRRNREKMDFGLNSEQKDGIRRAMDKSVYFLGGEITCGKTMALLGIGLAFQSYGLQLEIVSGTKTGATYFNRIFPGKVRTAEKFLKGTAEDVRRADAYLIEDAHKIREEEMISLIGRIGSARLLVAGDTDTGLATANWLEEWKERLPQNTTILTHSFYDLSKWRERDLFERIAASQFRSRFRLQKKDVIYVREKGLETIEKHARDLIQSRIVPADIPNDGKQTPMRGHPVFVAQHATGCCCRGCLRKWHGIPMGVALDEKQQGEIVAVLMEWIRRQCAENE